MALKVLFIKNSQAAALQKWNNSPNGDGFQKPAGNHSLLLKIA
jgi:hypothetical protein